MNTDHSGLNKFTGADDENYKLLLPEIQRMVENGSPLVADRHRRKGAACIAGKLTITLSGLPILPPESHSSNKVKPLTGAGSFRSVETKTSSAVNTF